jgi:hypothetical protein
MIVLVCVMSAAARGQERNVVAGDAVARDAAAEGDYLFV